MKIKDGLVMLLFWGILIRVEGATLKARRTE